MDILNVGLAELIFIFVIALMIFGPRRLPEIAAKAGKFVADLRRMSNSLLAEWQREINVSNQLEEFKKVKEEFQGVKQDLTSIRRDMGTAGRSLVNETKQMTASIDPVSPEKASSKFSPDSIPEISSEIQETIGTQEVIVEDGPPPPVLKNGIPEPAPVPRTGTASASSSTPALDIKPTPELPDPTPVSNGSSPASIKSSPEAIDD